MLAAQVTSVHPDDPLSGLTVGDHPEPRRREQWTTVDLRAAALNQHDLWSLRGVGLSSDRLPMVLGTDGAGVAEDGREVVIHAVVGGPQGHGVEPDEPRSLLSERYPGTLAERVSVPCWNLVDKPADLSFAEAACLPTAWLTAYRMLFRTGQAMPGHRVLVQGTGGGVATAAVVLGAAAGLEVWVTSRDSARRDRAIALGAAGALAAGERIPSRADLVLETVGAATWSHSVRSCRPGGTIVVAGATSGDPERMEIQRLFFQEIDVRGATMGSRDDLIRLLDFCGRAGVRPVIDSVVPLAQVRNGLARLAGGRQFGKIAVEI